jgi:hypothetical protein
LKFAIVAVRGGALFIIFRALLVAASAPQATRGLLTVDPDVTKLLAVKALG